MNMTKDIIKNKLANDNTWLERGVLAIWKRQTQDEKIATCTKYHNGIGFNGVDGTFMTSLGNQINRKSQSGVKIGTCLSPKQITIARKKMQKYAGQLLLIANENQKAKDPMDAFYAEMREKAIQADKWIQEQFNTGQVRFIDPDMQRDYEAQLAEMEAN